MENTLKHINQSPDRKMYQHKWEQLSNEQKQMLEDLVVKMETAHVKNLLTLAFSEVTEGIPQFARALFTKQCFEVINDTEGALIDPNYEKLSNEIRDVIGDEKTEQLLKLHSRNVLWSFLMLLDQGNPKYESTGVSWALRLFDPNLFDPCDIPKDIIWGLHEDFDSFDKT